MREGVRLRWHDFALDDEGIDAGLLSWERSFTEQFLPPNARILVIGCGSGRDVIAWSRQGHHVVGIDPAAAAIAAGRAALTARGLAAELLDGFFEDRPWAPAFDAVSFSYYTYCYIPDSASVGAIRSMSDPTLMAHPNTYQNRSRSPDDNGSVHANAGIGNLAFYLAIEGGRHPATGAVVPGVGSQNREQIERIFYRGIAQMLPARATFSLARAATIQAARDLYGASSAAVAAITDAWTAVGVQ